MKTLLAFALLMISALRLNAQVNGLTDPIRDYYVHEMSTVDANNIMYVFECNFTSDNRNSVFITDNQSAGQHGFYSWTIYYPKANSPTEYVKLSGATDLKLDGPSYVGYIDEIKGIGLVYAARQVVGIQYLKDGIIQRAFLDKTGGVSTAGGKDSFPENFPKYFNQSNKSTITKFTLQKLSQMYP